jgi:predicted nucleotide-binding protein
MRATRLKAALRSATQTLAPGSTFFRAKVFIGSSSEALPIAEHVRDSFRGIAEPRLWTDSIFREGEHPLHSLVRQVRENDAAILVASTDDLLTLRGSPLSAMRDNVLFEFGLFAGAFGLHRTHLLLPTADCFRVPSDLAGLTTLCHYPIEADRRSTDLAEAVARLRVQLLAGLRRAPARSNLSSSNAADAVAFRLLRFFSWARGELISLAAVPAREAPTQLAFRLKAVSSFVRSDAERMRIATELDDLLHSAAYALERFPADALDPVEFLRLPQTFEQGEPPYGAEMRLLMKSLLLRQPFPWGVRDDVDEWFHSRLHAFNGGRHHPIVSSDLADPPALRGPDRRTRQRPSRFEPPSESEVERWSRYLAADGLTLDGVPSFPRLRAFAWWRLGVAECAAQALSKREILDEWHASIGGAVFERFQALEKRLQSVVFGETSIG